MFVKRIVKSKKIAVFAHLNDTMGMNYLIIHGLKKKITVVHSRKVRALAFIWVIKSWINSIYVLGRTPRNISKESFFYSLEIILNSKCIPALGLTWSWALWQAEWWRAEGDPEFGELEVGNRPPGDASIRFKCHWHIQNVYYLAGSLPSLNFTF